MVSIERAKLYFIQYEKINGVSPFAWKKIFHIKKYIPIFLKLCIRLGVDAHFSIIISYQLQDEVCFSYLFVWLHAGSPHLLLFLSSATHFPFLCHTFQSAMKFSKMLTLKSSVQFTSCYWYRTTKKNVSSAKFRTMMRMSLYGSFCCITYRTKNHEFCRVVGSLQVVRL